jgi:hypothetical protein
VFRTYTPRDADLRQFCLPQPAPIDAAALLESFHRLDITALDGIDDDAPADQVRVINLRVRFLWLTNYFFFRTDSFRWRQKMQIGI